MKSRWVSKLFLFGAALGLGGNLISCSVTPSSSSLVPSSSDEVSSSSVGVTTEDSSTSYSRDESGFFIIDEKCICDAVNPAGSVAYVEEIDYEESTNLRLYESGNKIPLYLVKTNASNTFTANNYNRVDNSVAIVRTKGEVRFTLQCSFGLNRGVTIRPLEKNVDHEVDEARRLIHFSISEPGQYTFEFIKNATLHLFVDDMDRYEGKPAPSIYFGPGVHNKANSSYIGSNNMVDLPSGAVVHVDYGAIIEGGFAMNSKSNVTIYGGGIVTGAPFDRDAEKDSRLIPYEINYSSNITIEGITTLDPAGWCYNIYFSKDVTLRNIKIISSRANGDGISVQSCSNLYTYDSFVRSWDDSLVVKNYPEWSNRNNEGTTKNIVFDNCLLWTDLAQSMEVGYETVGDIMEGIHFRNITVLHALHKAPMSIHNGNNSTVKDVNFENITVEDCSSGRGDGERLLIDLTTTWSAAFSDKQKVTALGQIEDVSFKNVKVLDGNEDSLIRLLGCMDTRSAYYGSIHKIKGVSFEGVEVMGTKVASDYQFLRIGDYVESLSFA